MSAKIICNDERKDEIIKFLEKKFEKLWEELDVRACPDDGPENPCFKKTRIGISAEFPSGDIFGHTGGGEYIYGITSIFKQLKFLYPNIGIEGYSYCYEQISGGVYGEYFISNYDSKEVRVYHNFQRCVECGKWCFNGAFLEGYSGLHCLCSPACMLDYIICEGGGGYFYDLDDSKLDKQFERFEERHGHEFDGDECDTCTIMYDLLFDNFEEYLPELKENKNRIQKAITRRVERRISVAEKAELLELSNKIDRLN